MTHPAVVEARSEPAAVPARGKAAFVLSCELFEDFFDPIGVDFERFRSGVNGGWLFGYIEALRRFGVGAALFFVSARISKPTRLMHASGVPMWILPSPRIHRRIRESLSRRPAPARRAKQGLVPALRGRSPAVGRHVMPYVATPPVALARALRQEGCDVILCQEYEDPRFDVCVLLSRVMGLRIVAAFHGADAQRSRFERYLRPLSLRGSSGLIISQEHEETRMRSRYGSRLTEIRRIPNPVDCAVWERTDRLHARASLGLPADAKVVAWHGRVEVRKKGLDTLVRAWGRIPHTIHGRDVRLVMVGSGADREDLSRLLDGFPTVVWIDEFVRDNDALRRHLSAADVYAFPSRWEGFPVALMEAMACGLPVVATDSPGVRDILGRDRSSGGIIVAPDDPPAFADALSLLLEDERRATDLGSRARTRIEQRFSVDAVGQQLSEYLFPRSPENEGQGRQRETALHVEERG